MTAPEIRRRPGGRSARVRDAVLAAALEILGDRGPDGLTIALVADRSGVHETSIYRRWGSRENLLVDALLQGSEDALPIPDTGFLRSDLIAFAVSLGLYLESALGSALLRALAACSTNPAMDETRERFWTGRYALASAMIDRAIERGELPAATDPILALEALIGPIHFRALFTSEPIDESFVTRLIDVLISGLAPA